MDLRDVCLGPTQVIDFVNLYGVGSVGNITNI